MILVAGVSSLFGLTETLGMKAILPHSSLLPSEVSVETEQWVRFPRCIKVFCKESL